jgi:hypothetical protein
VAAPGADLGLRQKAEAAPRELRIEIARAVSKFEDEQDEPPIDERG